MADIALVIPCSPGDDPTEVELGIDQLWIIVRGDCNWDYAEKKPNVPCFPGGLLIKGDYDGTNPYQAYGPYIPANTGKVKSKIGPHSVKGRHKGEKPILTQHTITVS